jgi:hypothetical protein
VAIHLSGPPGGGVDKRHRTGRPDPRFDLAPGGVYRADRVTPIAGALLPHRFTLTCAPPGGDAIGGLFSVALSCRSPRLAVNQHPALWSPDLPRLEKSRGHPAGILSTLWRGLGGHPSERSTWGWGSRRNPGRAVHPPLRPCSGWGLPSRPGHPGRWCALTAPFHPYLCAASPLRHRRSVLCGTVLQVAPTGR